MLVADTILYLLLCLFPSRVQNVMLWTFNLSLLCAWAHSRFERSIRCYVLMSYSALWPAKQHLPDPPADIPLDLTRVTCPHCASEGVKFIKLTEADEAREVRSCVCSSGVA
jgi:hypothetical protein